MTDIAALVASLTLEEKALLTAGEETWSTRAIERDGTVLVPKVVVTDGPNGARGPHLADAAEALASVCVPCGSALGATWDPDLVHDVGALLGDEARHQGCLVLLAPTVNLHRSPLAGRNFECYSEDPLLTGRIATGFVTGVQSRRVAVTVKHFAGNEAEYQRMTMSSVIDERALRELYLLPFEMAVRDGGAKGIMTSYNRLNGRYCTEQPELLTTILRDEWGFDGFTLSDWYAVLSSASLHAGLELEMPGPARAFGPRLAELVRQGRVDEADLDRAATRLLRVFDWAGAFDGPATTERRPAAERSTMARRAVTESIVLLTNDGVLPLAADVRSIALIGPNAAAATIMGGGSASLTPEYRITPLEALQARLGATVDIVHEPGVSIARAVPALRESQLVGPDGQPGLLLEIHRAPMPDGEVALERRMAGGEILMLGGPGEGVEPPFSFRGSATFMPDESGTHTFSVVQAGRMRLSVAGQVLIDGIGDPMAPGEHYFGLGSEERRASIELEAGQPVALELIYSSEGTAGLFGGRIGHRVAEPVDLLDRAVAAAAGVDVAIVVVGTSPEWESEGHDRESLQLPAEQDGLVRRVREANPRTVVVVNTGAPVTMDWADDVGAIVQCWLGGQELANGLVDVLVGDAEPGGRLPTTFPQRLEHNPTFGNFPGENDEVRYGEGLLVGYRWYEARHLPVLFPFGHGLSYSSFTIGEPALSTAELDPATLDAGATVTVAVQVTNTGDRVGSEVVQCYVAPRTPRLVRPPQELKAFAKVHLDPGASTTVELRLDRRAFAYWDPGAPGRSELWARRSIRTPPPADTAPAPGWRVDPGEHEIRIGRSSADIAHVAVLRIGA